MAAALESRSRQSTQLGRYALYDQIAEGGMASVHLGRLTGPVGFSKIVAIKQMHESAARNPDFVAMFLDEARLSGRVQHPNVVATIDVIAKGGEAFLIMEYVHGEALSALLRAARTRDERLSPAFAVHIMCDVLAGLHAAHEAKDENGEPLGIVHRDVSPQNIMIGVDGIARVLDFGIAKAAGRLQETQTGQLKGKLGYMAPEQLLGRPLDRRTDVFAAGIVAWEMLSGRKMFDADSSGQLMYQVLEFEVPALSSFSDVPEELSQAVQRAMERDPNKRFATAKEFAHELEQTTELVSSRRVGEWVSSLCGEALTRRADQVRAIEAAATGGSSVVTRVGLGIPNEHDSYRPAKEDALTEPGTAATTIENPITEATPPPRRRWPWLVAVAGASLLGVIGIWASQRGEAPAPVPAAQVQGPVAVAPTIAQTSAAPAAAREPAPPATTATQTVPPKKLPKRVVGRTPAHPPTHASQPVKKPEDLFSRQ